MLVGELQPFFNRQSSISRQIRHVFSMRVHKGALNDAINDAQKGCAMQMWWIALSSMDVIITLQFSFVNWMSTEIITVDIQIRSLSRRSVEDSFLLLFIFSCWHESFCLQQVLCVTVAALIHYFYLSSFCWMLMEGIMLYLLIIEVYNTELKLPLCYGFSLGECFFSFSHNHLNKTVKW